MNIEQLAAQFPASEPISPTLAQRLRIPRDRLAIYRFVLDRDPRNYRHLLLALFDEEIYFREALWNGTVNDDGDFCEGIYHCAFLIHCCGMPCDTATLWKVQYLNQDIGELDAEYFIGVGLAETLAYLSKVEDESSKEIAGHIDQWSRHASLDSLANWREGRRQWIRDDAERMASKQ
jgi:hypothetical protein